MDNSVLRTDSYKLGHHRQYPKGLRKVYSYLGTRNEFGDMKAVKFFGLQYILKRFLSKPITMENVEEVRAFAEAHGEPFNYEGWKYIVEKHHGKLPVRIKAVREGSIVPVNNVLLTIVNTDEKCGWLVGYLETLLLRVWYPCTVATHSNHLKDLIYPFCELTCDNPDEDIKFKVHDFGARGCSCGEQAEIGGMSHLTAFYGSDTIEGIWTMNKYYNEGKMSGWSIPASEHSTIISWGKEGEVDAYRNMLEQHPEYGVIACVSDSYDIYNAIENIWGGVLKDEVVKSGKTLVVRPDSGDPVEVAVKCIELLDKKFGHTINSKGFKVLNSTKVIQGDGINYDTIKAILTKLFDLGYSAQNINFGCGGNLLVKGFTRDSFGFNFKNSADMFEGGWIGVCKEPVTSQYKASLKGLVSLYRDNHAEGKPYVTLPLSVKILEHQVKENGDPHFRYIEQLEVVYLNGELLSDITLDELR